MTLMQRSALDSWFARLTASMLRFRKHPEEPIGFWWRRMHRCGHKAIQEFDIPVSQHARMQVHRWGGHVARLPSDHFVASAVRCRSLQWWRWRQSEHTSTHWSVHPQRFKVFRWEEQLSKVHGVGLASDASGFTGWLGLAQDRIGWREAEQDFLIT